MRSFPLFGFLFSILLLLIAGHDSLYAQGELTESSRILIRNERSAGLTLSSNGFGANYRYGKHIDVNRKWLIQANLHLIKHEKETKSSSYLYQNKSFVYGKLNTLYTLHLTTGTQHELYSKFDAGGVAIRYFYLGGLSLGLLKPKYYEVSYITGETEVEDFETFLENSINFHGGAIVGNASWFDGIEKTKIKPGLTATIGFSFDYSTGDHLYNAIEAGLTADFFPDPVSIMHHSEGNAQQFFISLFLTYRFGRILDGF
jgi:hypothetical protein